MDTDNNKRKRIREQCTLCTNNKNICFSLFLLTQPAFDKKKDKEAVVKVVNNATATTKDDNIELPPPLISGKEKKCAKTAPISPNKIGNEDKKIDLFIFQ